ncbi:carboxylate--amine ligase [Enterococcus sp. LJL98]
MEQMKFIPILLGSDMNVYGMAKSFHEAYGMKSVAYAGHVLAPTRYSKIVTVHPTPGFEEDPVFTETLLKLAKTTYNNPEMQYLLIPCGDGYAELLSKNKEKLAPYYTFIANDYALFEKLVNKVSFYEVCETYQLPYPKTLIISKDSLVEGKFIDSLPFEFPVALKPANSVEWLSIDFEGRKKAFIIEERAEFDVIIERIYQAGYQSDMIAQDFIPGDDSNMRVLNAYIDHKQQVRMMGLGHPLLEDPTPGSVGNYVVILPDENQAVYQQIEAFLKQIHYVGFANFDMKYDSRDQTYKLFEINLRQGRSSFFLTLNGLNLAKFITEDLILNVPFTKTVYGQKGTSNDRLWLGAPKKVFLTYAKENAEKERAKMLLRNGQWGTTVFYAKDWSLRRWGLMQRAFYTYHERFKKYFQGKEG